jgi:hypothetical protein
MLAVLGRQELAPLVIMIGNSPSARFHGSVSAGPTSRPALAMLSARFSGKGTFGNSV